MIIFSRRSGERRIHAARALGAMLALISAGSTVAQDYRAGAISIRNPWSRETAVGQSAGGGFVTLINRGKQPDRLVSASSPIASEVQIHTMTMDGGIMRMRQLKDGIPLPAGKSVVLRPGAEHVMFIGLKRPMKKGESVPVTLRFQRAGSVTVKFAVQAIGSTSAMESSHAK